MSADTFHVCDTCHTLRDDYGEHVSAEQRFPINWPDDIDDGERAWFDASAEILNASGAEPTGEHVNGYGTCFLCRETVVDPIIYRA